MKKKKVLLSWSGGKNSALSLFELKSPEYKLIALLTTVTNNDRVKTHEIPLALLEVQAACLEIPLILAKVSPSPFNEEYESTIKTAILSFKKKGLEGLAFGDLGLQDMRDYRDRICRNFELESIYPIWNWKAEHLLKVFFGLGFKAIVVSVNLAKLPLTFVGREYDPDFVDNLPSGIDPCGENGEFHTFVYDGPFFQKSVLFKREKVRDYGGYGFQDLVV